MAWRDGAPAIGAPSQAASMSISTSQPVTTGQGVMPSHYFGFLVACSILAIPDQDLGLLRPPQTHSRIPGEFARHLCFHGWML